MKRLISFLMSMICVLVTSIVPVFGNNEIIGSVESFGELRLNAARNRSEASTSQKVVWDHDPGYGYASGIITLHEDGRYEYVYCIEPYEKFPSGHDYEANAFEDPGIRAILEYGFPNNSSGLVEKYSKSESQAYVATYVAINTYLGNFNANTVSKGSDGYVDELLALASKGLERIEVSVINSNSSLVYMDNLELLVSAESYYIDANRSTDVVFSPVDLPDNVVLLDKDYQVIDAVISNSEFYIALRNVSGQIEVTLEFEAYNFVSNLTKYTSSGVQTLISGNETENISLDAFAKYDPNYGNILVTKVDKETHTGLAGAKFRLVAKEDIFVGTNTVYQTNDVVAEGESDDGGKWYVNDLPFGTYELFEVSPPLGYVGLESSEIIVVNDANLNSELTLSTLIENERILGKVRVIKHGEGQLLQGVGFSIYNRDGVEVSSGVTNALGVFESGALPFGNYILKETDTLDGYIKSDVNIDFDISSHNEVIEIKVENYRVNGVLEVIKRDATTGKPLKGIVFGLYKFVSGNPILVSEHTTDAIGKIRFEKLHTECTYGILEHMTLPGYQLDETLHLIDFGETDTHNVVLKKVLALDNEQLPLQLVVMKRDSKTNEIVNTSSHIFELIDEDGNIVSLESASNGVYSWTLQRFKKYELHELYAPDGYIVSKETVTIDTRENLDSTVIEVSYFNEPEVPPAPPEPELPNTGYTTSYLKNVLMVMIGFVVLAAHRIVKYRKDTV